MKAKNTLPKKKAWDNIANDYGNDITNFEKETTSFLVNKIKNLKITTDDSIIEIGCGSGHISLLMAKLHYKVDLLDFSKVALDKAKKVFNLHKIHSNFINNDIFDLKDIPKYNICWNSGVMEHFNDIELEIALKSIHQKTKKYFIFLVPNPNSFLYLYYRFLMTQSGKWNVGYEFLRTNYRPFIKKSGFKVIESGYTGKLYSENHIEYCFKDNEKIISDLKYMINNDMFTKNQYYLKYYICKTV